MLMSVLTNTQKLDTENAPISWLKFLKIQRIDFWVFPKTEKENPESKVLPNA